MFVDLQVLQTMYIVLGLLILGLFVYMIALWSVWRKYADVMHDDLVDD